MGLSLTVLFNLGERNRRVGVPFDGAELRLRREMLGYTRLDLASRWGIAESTLYRWEMGRLRLEHPGMVADALSFLESVEGKSAWVRTQDGALRLATGEEARRGRPRRDPV